VRAWEHHKPVFLRHPKAVRPWQHVLNPLGGYLLLVEKLYNRGKSFAEAWNFGPERSDSCPVVEVVDKFGENGDKLRRTE